VASGARLRNVIVTEGVHLPAGFTAGWDSESDRRNFTVTPGGVVVISETPRKTKPPTIHFRDKTIGAGYTPHNIIERCA
jgi:ADP-glucose pyrophosphorylase